MEKAVSVVTHASRCPIRNNTWLFRLLLLLAVIVSGGFCAVAQSSSPHYLLALSKSDHVLAIVDPSSLQVVARVPVGPDPHEVIASDDGKTAYISNYGGGSLHELDIIDLVTRKPLASVDSKPLMGLHGLTFAAGKLWFTAEGSKAVGRFDPQTGQIDWCMGTGQDRTHMIYVTSDGRKIYTTNVSSGSVSILIDTMLPAPKPPPGQGFPPGGQGPPGGGPGGPGGRPRRDWTEIVIPVSKGSEGFDVSPDGNQLWTAAANDGMISIIDLVNNKAAGTIDAKAFGANRLKFTPDGKRVLVTSLSSGDLLIFDVASRKEIGRLSVGHGAAGILVAPDGKRAFLGCTADNYVAVVDLRTVKVVGHIDVGGGPDGLAWAFPVK